MLKRQNTSAVPDPKRRALRPVSQLATPPTTPEKKSVIDLSSSLSGHARKLHFTDSIYSKAKALFQRGAKMENVTHLVGRSAEADAFSKFINMSLTLRKCASLYVSGPPGTGKTAQINLTLDSLIAQKRGSPVTQASGIRHIHHIHGANVLVMRVNCMAISKPENIYHEIYCHVTGQAPSRKQTFDDLYKVLLEGNNSIDSLVVVLDEMDSLITKDQQVLFQLFHCASHLKSSVLNTKLILVGISNALDLTDKFLPRLRSNGFNPESIQFMPYSGDQIKQVILSKLRSLVEEDKENLTNAIPIMHPTAITLCCKKCSTVTGDLRKAFDICYKSIELVEKQTQQSETFSSLTFESAPKVMIGHVARACASTFGDNTLARLNNLNLLQKAVLCCLFSMENTSLTKAPTVNELYDFYCKYTLECTEELLGRLKKGDFLEIVGALESSSTVVLASKQKTYSMHVDVGNKTITPNVPLTDLERSIDEVGVLRRILRVGK